MDITYQIPRRSLIWVLSAVVMALAPHALRLPMWISVVATACILWRILIFLGKLDYPGKVVRVVVVLFILAGSASQLRSLEIGLDVAASLLALGFIFKLVEMQSKRDIYVVLTLCFIMALVSLIYSQSMVTTMYLTLMVIVIIGSMVSVNRTAPGWQTARHPGSGGENHCPESAVDDCPVSGLPAYRTIVGSAGPVDFHHRCVGSDVTRRHQSAGPVH